MNLRLSRLGYFDVAPVRDYALAGVRNVGSDLRPVRHRLYSPRSASNGILLTHPWLEIGDSPTNFRHILEDSTR